MPALLHLPLAIVWCLISMVSAHLHSSDANTLEKISPRESASEGRPNSSIEDMHYDLLKLYHNVLSQMRRRDRTKKKVELLQNRLERLMDIGSRVRKLEEKVRAMGATTLGGVSSSDISNQKGDNESVDTTRVLGTTSPESGVPAVQAADESLRERDSQGACQALLAELSSKVKRYHQFLQKVGATLHDQGKQIEELQMCSVVQGDVMERQSAQLDELDAELAVQKVILQKLQVDDQWRHFRMESLENTTYHLKEKVSQLDVALKDMNAHNEKVHPPDVNWSQRGSDCGKPSTLETSKTHGESIQAMESPQAFARASAQPSSGIRQNFLKTLMTINGTQNELRENFSALKQTVWMLSLDVSSNKAELDMMDERAQLLLHQIDKLRQSDIKRSKHGRRLRKSLRQLSRDVKHLCTISGDSLQMEVRRTSNTAGPPSEVASPLPGGTKITKAYRGISESKSTVHRGNGLKREIEKYYITPPPPVVTTGQHNTEGSLTTKPHPYPDESQIPVVTGDSGEVRDLTPPAESNNRNAVLLQGSSPLQHTNSCHLEDIGPPVVVHQLPKTASGWWRRDTWSLNRDSVYLFLNTYKANHLYEYPTLAHLQNGTGGIVYHLPFSCSGSGHIIHHRNLICNQFTTNRIMKYDLLTREVRSRRLPDSGFHNSYPYTFGRLSDMDFAFDEVGMWVVYGSSRRKGSMVIAKLNPETLKVEGKWQTPFLKTAVGNTFIICRKLYVVDYRNSGGKVTSVYNIKTSSAMNLQDRPEIGSEQGAFRTMLDYNPSDGTLYAWHMSRERNGQLVTYKVFVRDP